MNLSCALVIYDAQVTEESSQLRAALHKETRLSEQRQAAMDQTSHQLNIQLARLQAQLEDSDQRAAKALVIKRAHMKGIYPEAWHGLRGCDPAIVQIIQQVETAAIRCGVTSTNISGTHPDLG